jgi:hypothetical protein
VSTRFLLGCSAVALVAAACGGDAFTTSETGSGGSGGASSATGGSAGESATAGSGGTDAAGGATSGGAGGSTSAGTGGVATAGTSATAGSSGVAGSTAGSAGKGGATGGSGGKGGAGGSGGPTLEAACQATTGSLYDPVGKHCYVDITSTQGPNIWSLSGAVTACQPANLGPAISWPGPIASSHLLAPESVIEQDFVTNGLAKTKDLDLWVHLDCPMGTSANACACGATCNAMTWRWEEPPNHYWDPIQDAGRWTGVGPGNKGRCVALTPATATTEWKWEARDCSKYMDSGRLYRVICEIQ